MNKEKISLEEAKRLEAIELFTKVRNVPFVLGIDRNPNKLFPENKGNDYRKHLYLYPRLKRLGYKVELYIAEFDWRRLPVPNEIISLLKEPIQNHLFLLVNGKVLDASWHPGMPEGFRVNNWDGENSTRFGVTPQVLTKVNPAVLQTHSLANSFLNNFVFANEDKLKPFNNAFNFWVANSK